MQALQILKAQILEHESAEHMQWLTQLATDAVPKYGKVIIPTGEYTKGDIVAQVNVRDGIRGTIDQIKSKSSNFRIAVLKNFTGTL